MALLPRLPQLPQRLSLLSDYKSPVTLPFYLLAELDDLLEANSKVLEDLQTQERLTARAFEEMHRQLQSLDCSQLPALVKPAVETQFALQLVSFPTTPLYVKRKFDITFRLTAPASQSVSFDHSLYCALTVQKMTPNAEEVTKTRSGKPILRGQLVRGFAPKEPLSFQGLVFLDISGPFPQGRVNLLIRCVNFDCIRPLLIEGVRIKARKKCPGETF